MDHREHPGQGFQSGFFRNSKKTIILLILLLILAASVFIINSRTTAVKTALTEELEALSRLKTTELVQWREERLSEASFFQNHEKLRELSDLTSEITDTGIIESLTALFKPFLNDWRYDEIWFFSTTGEVVFTLPETNTAPDPVARNSAGVIVESGKIQVTGFNGEGPASFHFDILVPVRKNENSKGGMLLLRSDPEKYLFPLIEAWPSAEESSEILIVRRETDSVRIITSPGPSGERKFLSFPYSRDDIAAVQAALGRAGVFTGNDYSGRKVVSYLSKIPGSEWYLVVKEDRRDIYSELFLESFLVILVIILIFMLYLLLYRLFVSRREMKVQQELYESEARFRALYEHSMDAMLLTTPDGTIQSANPAACKLFGMTEPEIIEKGRAGLVDLSDSRLGELLKERTITGSSKGELRFLRYDGSAFEAEVSSSVFPDKNNRLRTSMIIRDITRRIRYEDSLRKSREQLGLMIESAPVAIAMLDLDMKYLVTSKKWLREFGRGRSDLTRLSHYEVLADIPERWKEFHRRGLAGESTEENEDLWIQDDGTEYWLRWSVVPWFDGSGNIGGIIISTENITAHKKAESDVRLLNRRLEDLITSVKELAASRTMDTIREVVKRSSRSLIGSDGMSLVLKDGESCYYADEEAISPLWKGQRFPMESCISGWAMTRQENVIIEDIYNDPRINLSLYANTFVKSLLMVPLKFDMIIGAIGNYWSSPHQPEEMEVKLIESLSDAAAIAIENVRLYDELEKRVLERTKQLLAVNKELEAFSYSVSHDLRAPLRGIDGFTGILLDEYSDTLGTEGRRLCSVIRENTKRMGELIDDLLSLSKIGQKSLQISRIDMKAMVNSVYHEITTPAERNRVTLSIGDLEDAQGDPNLIRQVWANLLSNAVKFSSRNEHPVIDVSCDHDDETLIYCIRDNGAGFEMKYYEKLFGVFQRLHSQRDYEGTGVGLAIVRRIILKHGGEVRAEGMVNEGASFFFSLPRNINVI